MDGFVLRKTRTPFVRPSGGLDAVVLIAVIPSALGMVVILALAAFSDDGSSILLHPLLGPIATAAFALLMLGIASPLVTIPVARMRRQHAELRAFGEQLDAVAAANGWERGPLVESFDPLHVPATSGFDRTRPRVLLSVTGTTDGVPIAVQLIRRRHARTVERFGMRTNLVYRATVPVLLPHTLLLPRDIDGGLTATVIDRMFDDEQRVSLQSDLDATFLFYTHRRTVTDALSYWDPALLDRVRGIVRSTPTPLAIETIGRDVYVSTDADRVVSGAFDAALELLELLVPAARRAARARRFLQLPNDDKYPYLRSTEQPGVVIGAGRTSPAIIAGLVLAGVLSIGRLIIELGLTPLSLAIAIGIVALLVLCGWSSTRIRSGFTRGRRRGY